MCSTVYITLCIKATVQCIVIYSKTCSLQGIVTFEILCLVQCLIHLKIFNLIKTVYSIVGRIVCRRVFIVYNIICNNMCSTIDSILWNIVFSSVFIVNIYCLINIVYCIVGSIVFINVCCILYITIDCSAQSSPVAHPLPDLWPWLWMNGDTALHLFWATGSRLLNNSY